MLDNVVANMRSACYYVKQIPSCRVVVTDGHPDCVSNQNICIRMNNQARSTAEDKSKLCVTSHLLRWSKGDPQNDLAEILENNKHHSKDADGKFERIVAADCLIFRDFHDDLVWLLQSALAPNGVIFMLQPARGVYHIVSCYQYSDLCDVMN